MLKQLKALYEQYIRESQEVFSKAKPTDGLFGMGDDPRKNPCHDRFYGDVGRWVEAFLQNEPTADAAAEAAEWIIKAAHSHRDEAAFWYLYAAQGHVQPLIGRMSAERCEALRRWYDEAYLPIERMPVHKTVYKLLRKNAKAKK